MSKMSGKTKMLLIALAIVVLLPIGFLFFRYPMAHIVMPAERLGTIFGFPITNTMLASWWTMLVLIVVSVLATRKMQFIPSGLQNLLEAGIEFLLGTVEGVAGRENGRRFFPLVASIFLFILISNWSGLLPGFGTIGLVNTEHPKVQLKTTKVAGINVGLLLPNAKENKEEVAPAGGEATATAGHEASTAAVHEEVAAGEGEVYGLIDPFFRSANTDLNNTIALAVVAMILVQYFGISALGARQYAKKFFNFKLSFMGMISGFVGILELVTEFAKIVSFSFRLFGNIFAGEVLLAVMAFLMPFAAALPFLGLELFVGFIQAVVFAVLVLVFSSLAVMSHGSEHGHEEHGKPAHETH